MRVLAANSAALIGCVLLVAAGYAKTKERTVILQSCQLVVMACANIILAAYTGAVLNTVSIFRNIVVLRGKYGNAWRAAFCLVIILSGAAANNRGLPGWLTVAGNIAFTVCLGTTAKTLKLALAFCISCWCVYDFSVRDYVAGIADILICVSSLMGYRRLTLEGKGTTVKDED